MKQKKIKTKTPGVRYYEHKTRKYGVKFDRYYTIRYKIDGKDKEEALGWASNGWTEQKAAERLAELKQAQRTGDGAKTLDEKRKQAKEKEEKQKVIENQRKRELITFSEVFEKYFVQSQQDKTRQSWHTEELLYRNWLSKLMADKPLREITPFILEKLKKAMTDNGRQPRTVTYALQVVRQVFNYAKNHDLFNGDNPVSKVKKPSNDNRRNRYLEKEEAEKLLKALEMRSPQLHNISLVSLHCGLRAGEIFNLTWENVNFKRDFISVTDTKSGRNRNIPMTNEVRNMLEEVKKTSTTELVFVSSKGERIKEVSRTFDRVVEELGFNINIKDSRNKVVFHTLRHTYASWLVMSGTDLYSVQKLMGHSTMAMTERYSHLSPNHLQKAIANFEEYVNKSKEQEKLVVITNGALN